MEERKDKSTLLLLLIVIGVIIVLFLMWQDRKKKSSDNELTISRLTKQCNQTPASENIFVGMIIQSEFLFDTSYRKAIENLFQQAYCPARIKLVLVIVNGDESDRDRLTSLLNKNDIMGSGEWMKIQILLLPSSKLGKNGTYIQALKLVEDAYRGERYFCLIGAQCYTCSEWDRRIIQFLENEIPSSSQVLITSLVYESQSPKHMNNQMENPDMVPQNFRMFHKFSPYGTPVGRVKQCLSIPQKPLKTYFLEKDFLFTEAKNWFKVCRVDLNFDPLPADVYFWTLSIRIYLAGIDIYHLPYSIVYQLSSSSSVDHFSYKNNGLDESKSLYYLSRFLNLTQKSSIIDLQKSSPIYNSGSGGRNEKRDLNQFQIDSGIDWNSRRISPYAQIGLIGGGGELSINDEDRNRIGIELLAKHGTHDLKNFILKKQKE